MCSICAGTCHDADGGRVDADLKAVYTLVLPICATCRNQGAKIMVGRYVPNIRALLKRLEYDRHIAAMQRAKSA